MLDTNFVRHELDDRDRADLEHPKRRRQLKMEVGERELRTKHGYGTPNDGGILVSFGKRRHG